MRAFAGAVFDAVDLYNSVTGTWSTAQLSVARSRLAATSVGNMALFAGGGLHAPNEVPWRGMVLRVWSDCGKGRFCMAYKRLRTPSFVPLPCTPALLPSSRSLAGSDIVDIYRVAAAQVTVPLPLTDLLSSIQQGVLLSPCPSSISAIAQWLQHVSLALLTRS